MVWLLRILVEQKCIHGARKMKKLLIFLLFGYVSVTYSASIEGIANNLYSKFGTFDVAGKAFDKDSQYSFVSQWVSRYAAGKNHPMRPMERLIIREIGLNSHELEEFNCKKKFLGGFKCIKSNSEENTLFVLDGNKRIKHIDACLKLPSDLKNQFKAASSNLVPFALAVQTMAYNQNASLFEYRSENESICASYER